ncbi:hypothetical protein MBLNU13_g11713t2 [Cladosporium sp. NU13]
MLDKILDIIARDGGITVFNLLPPELLNEYMTAIEPHMSDRKLYDSKATHEESGDAFFSEGSQRVHTTAVIPGSHLWPSDRAPKVEEGTYAEMEPRSALFTLGCTYTWSLIWRIATPIEIARTLPEDILKLADYSKAVSGVGFVEDHESPLEYLHNDNTGIGAFEVTV